MQKRRTSSMGHLGTVFLLIAALTCIHVFGAASHSLPACREQLDFRCSDGSCIPKLSVCDGHADCKDGSDERRCGHTHSLCGNHEFACHNRRCISLRFRCDGIENCGDGSDETSCQNCTAFSCGPSDTCLSTNQLCDGRVNCRDGRDETPELCGSPPTCKSSEFHCGDGQCIPQTWRCDNSMDCSDGGDEHNCDHNECAVNNGGCSHVCKDLPMGFICECPHNMTLVGDNQCEEVNVCLERDVCDQLCVHVNGDLTCDCYQGYRMNPTTGDCKAKGEEARLIFTSSNGLQWMSVSGSEDREPARHLRGPGQVAALVSDWTLYWVQQGRDVIYRVSMDQMTADPVPVLKVQGSVSGLALDWIHRLLYWTSMESGSVNVGLLDGSAQRPLITGLEEPSGVAVDPLHGLIFWAQCGSSPKIERADLDGQNRKALVTHLIRHPVALSLDVPRQLLFWIDQGTKTISRVNLEGHHRKTVVESNGYLDRPFGLAVFEGFVYWSEAVTQSICRASKHNGRSFSVLLSNATSPGGVAIAHPALQPKGPSVCSQTGRFCQHECTVDLLSDSPEFRCKHPETAQKKSEESPAISHRVPESALSYRSFAGILSLGVSLIVLLVGTTLCWWCRGHIRMSRPHNEQSFSLKESQDPLIVPEATAGPDKCTKETLVKLDFDGE